MADGNLPGCGMDTEEELPRLIPRLPDDVLDHVAVVDAGWNPIDSANLLSVWQNEGRQVAVEAVLADNPDSHTSEVLECHVGAMWLNVVVGGRDGAGD